MNVWTFIGTLILAAAAFFFLFGFLTTYLRYRRAFLITCPENYQPAGVKVDAIGAGRWAALSGEPYLHLNQCTRWPEMAGCDQACLAQLEHAPEACAVRNIVSAWYEGKRCVYCKGAIENIAWHERPPAVRTPDGVTREWKDFQTERLPIAFSSGEAVCWHCHIVESFRKERPELVVERKRVEEPRVTLVPSTAVY